MKITVDVKPCELEDTDTIAGYKIKDIATLAYCLRQQGITNEEVGEFIRNIESAYNVVMKDTQDALDKALTQCKQEQTGTLDEYWQSMGQPYEGDSKPGDKVLDPFGGSGTTVIACEQLNRRAYTIEYDPKYADVIIARWEKLTGEKAVKING